MRNGLPRLSRGLHLDRRIEPDAQHRALRHLDFLALGRGRDAAAADDGTEHRALHATEDATKDGACARTGCDAAGLTLDAFALDGLGHRAANRVGAAVDSDLVEAHGHLRRAVGP